MTKQYIKKYRVTKVSEHLYTLLEHIEGGLYIAHNPMPFSDLLRALTTINKHSDTHYNLIVCDDLDLLCEMTNCDKPANSRMRLIVAIHTFFVYVVDWNTLDT